MSKSNLTAKYRPQLFSEVAGQQAVKTILSRAAEQDKVAPAYLFSGTRGVGKTTIARIFAKALNCKNAPTGEPCNECENCKQITAGIGVDVVEIDAASHGGVDDARRLKEDIGYAPIEFRYKVFIIDEAHMLTTPAFNALLKTLEEPPAHATFIMATTETHKFPATIISRCQHYAFKMLSGTELTAHLENVLNKESLAYEKGAVELIAKRGAGSVRDSMSLLGQVLALGSEKLLEEDVRSILGLAGRDVFFNLMQAMHDRDLVGVADVVQQVLEKGLDLGFFMRELSSCWRNMFLLGQSGERAIPLLGLSTEDAKSFMHWATTFDRAFIHACWQMTVDGQRKVLNSLEPAMALELLLLNMASLPDLISVERVGALAKRSQPSVPVQSGSTPRATSTIPQRQDPPVQNVQAGGLGRNSGRSESGAPAGASAQTTSGSEESALPDAAESTQTTRNPIQESQCNEPIVESSNVVVKDPTAEVVEPVQPASMIAESGDRSFEGFLKFVHDSGANGTVSGLTTCKGEILGRFLKLTCNNSFHKGQIEAKECRGVILSLAKKYFGDDTELEILVRESGQRKSRKQIREEVEDTPEVKLVMENFGASIVSVEPRKR